MRNRLVATSARVVLALGLGPAIVSCSGSIASSPYAPQFNAALDRCENLSNSQMRTACSQRVINHYSRLLQQEKKHGEAQPLGEIETR